MKLVPGKLYKIYDRYALNLIGVYIGEEYRFVVDGDHNDMEIMHYKFLIGNRFEFFNSDFVNNVTTPFRIRLAELE